MTVDPLVFDSEIIYIKIRSKHLIILLSAFVRCTKMMSAIASIVFL